MLVLLKSGSQSGLYNSFRSVGLPRWKSPVTTRGNPEISRAYPLALHWSHLAPLHLWIAPRISALSARLVCVSER